MRAYRIILRHCFVFVLSAWLAISASAAAFERDISREFIDQSGRELTIDTGDGNINVRSGDDDSTLIQVKLTVSASSQEKADKRFDAVEVDISESTNGVQVKIRSEGNSFWAWIFGKKTPSVEVYAICPKSSNLRLDTGSGEISVADISGEIVLDTGSGDIMGSGISGQINSDTGSGNIVLDGVSGTVSGDTGSGNIKVLDLNGTIDGDTGSGSIIAKGAITQFSASTGSGSVVIESTINDPLQSSVSTGSGNIDIYMPITANFHFKGSTNSGDIRADFPSSSVVSASEDSIELVINQDGALISAQAGSGDVSLYPGAPQ